VNKYLKDLQLYLNNRQHLLEEELKEAYSMREPTRILDLESRLSEIAGLQMIIDKWKMD